MTKQKEIRYDEFVAAIRSDGSTNSLKLIQGFIGKSSEDGHLRIYLDAALNNFIDVVEDDIIYTKELSAENSPLGGSMIWIKEESVFKFGDPKSNLRPTSSFLQGDLMQAYARAGSSIAKGGINQITPGIINDCKGIFTEVCQNAITNDCSFLISSCGTINTGIDCANGMTLIPTCIKTRTITPPPCNNTATVGCGNSISIIPTDGCGQTASLAPPCGSIQTNGCGVTQSIAPPPPTGCGSIQTNGCGITQSIAPPPPTGCGSIQTNGCGVTRSILPPPTCGSIQTYGCGVTQSFVPTGCSTILSNTCGSTRSLVPTGCGSFISDPCGGTRTFVITTTGCAAVVSNPGGCGLNYSTLPPTTFRFDNPVNQNLAGGAYGTYSPYGF